MQASPVLCIRSQTRFVCALCVATTRTINATAERDSEKVPDCAGGRAFCGWWGFRSAHFDGDDYDDDDDGKCCGRRRARMRW